MRLHRPSNAGTVPRSISWLIVSSRNRTLLPSFTNSNSLRQTFIRTVFGFQPVISATSLIVNSFFVFAMPILLS